MPVDQVPAGRAWHSTVWTGSEMLVWGGAPTDLTQGHFNDGARFLPTAALWRPLPELPTLSARAGHLAVWTGQIMWIWGGANEDGDSEPARQGMVFDPAADVWTISQAGTIPAGRTKATAVWTGRGVVVWGGSTRIVPGYLADGAIYDPKSDSWTTMSTKGAPSGRYFHGAVWTGSRMIIWGGSGSSDAATTGGSYDPATDRWQPMSSAGGPGFRGDCALWTGREMLVWEGSQGGRYDAQADSWRPIAQAGAPSARSLHTCVWTGRKMVVWGGYAGGETLQDGAIYDPEADRWTSVPLDGAPSARRGHSAVWTGDMMLIWGGTGATGVVSTGAAFLLPSS